MEIILSLLKQLASVLSPTEFLAVMSLIAVSVFIIVKWLLKQLAKGKKDGIVGLFASNEADDLKSIQTKLNEVMTLEEFERAFKLVSERLIQANERVASEIGSINQRLEALSVLSREVQLSFKDVGEDLDDVKSHVKLEAATQVQNVAVLKSELTKTLELLQRTLSQVEKIDEFAKASIPEFRGYHKELAKSLSDLSRDVALVERSIQTQINTGSAVKLR